MNAEDWSQRLPEMKEWVERLEQHRGQVFAEAFADMTHIFDSLNDTRRPLLIFNTSTCSILTIVYTRYKEREWRRNNSDEFKWPRE